MLPSIYNYRWGWLPDPDLVQHVSLPLEIIGLFLALLEIYFPQHADRLELWLDKLAKSLFPSGAILILGRVFDNIPKGKHMRAFWLTVFGFVVSTWLVRGVYTLWFRENTETFTYIYRSLPHWGAFIFIAYLLRRGILLEVLTALTVFCATYPVFVSILCVTLVIGAFDRMGMGKATGGIGLTLGGLGFLGEIYQVAMLNDDPVTRLEYWSIIVALLTALGIVVFFVHRIIQKEKRPPASA